MRQLSRRTMIGVCGASFALGAGCLGETEDESDPDSNGNGSWNSFRSGPANAGFVETDGPRTEPEERWTTTLSTGPGTAAIADETAYLAAGSTLQAIGVASGETQWTIDLERERTGSPAVTDTAVVCPTTGGLVVVDRDGADERRIAFDSETASMRVMAQQETRSAVPSSPTVVDGTAYVGTPNGNLVAVELDAAEVTWRSSATVGWTTLSQARQSGSVVSSPAVADGRVIVGTESGIAAFDAADGSNEWTHGTEGAVRSSPAVVDGTVYVGGARPIALTADTGDREWRSGDAFAAMTGRWTERRGGVRRLQKQATMEPSVAVADDVVVVSDPGEQLVALDRSDGSTEWELTLERAEFRRLAATSSEPSARAEPMATQIAPSWSSPAIAGDVVVVGTSQGIVAASLADGDELWRFPTARRVVASPAAAAGTVVVGDSGGTVYALAEP